MALVILPVHITCVLSGQPGAGVSIV